MGMVVTRRIKILTGNYIWAESVQYFARQCGYPLYFFHQGMAKEDAYFMASPSVEQIASIDLTLSRFILGDLAAIHNKDDSHRELIQNALTIPQDSGLRDICEIFKIFFADQHTKNTIHPVKRLSDKEGVILKLLKEHCSDKEIAYRLNLPLSNVKYYIRKLYQRLGISKRSEVFSITDKNLL